RAEETVRQQQLESPAAQRSVAVPAARRAGDGLHDRPSSRLPHAVRPAREDQLREDGKDRAADSPGELGHRQQRRAPKAAGNENDVLTTENTENTETCATGAGEAGPRTKRKAPP